jgi:hypothetical protein
MPPAVIGVSMAITFQCASCGRRYKVKDRLAGRRVKCKDCGAALRIPDLEDFPDLLAATDEDTAGEELSPSGHPIWRHTERKKDFQPATGGASLEAVTGHIEEHVGQIAFVYHELVSDLVHIDVHVVQPTEEKPYYTLITSGMSDQPMAAPQGADEWRFAELLISLPAGWPMDQKAFEDESNYWPIRWLKTLARFPHEYNTWLWHGHSVPNGNPAQPFAANTNLCCALLLQPMLVPDDFLTLETADKKAIHFFSLVPLYRDEMEFKLKKGLDSLLEKFAEQEVNELLDVGRTSVCSRKGWSL